MPTSKYIQSRECLLTLKRFDHFNCKAIHTGKVQDNQAEVIMVYCPHLKENRKILIERKDI